MTIRQFICMVCLLLSGVSHSQQPDVIETSLEARKLGADGQFELAVDVAEKALALSLEQLQQPHLYTSLINDDLAKYNLQLVQLDRALEHSIRAVQIIDQLGSDSKQYRSDVLFNKAAVLSELGRYAESIPILEEIYSDRKLNFSGTPKYASVVQAYGFALLEYHEYELAQQILAECVAVWQTIQQDIGPQGMKCLIAKSKIGMFRDDARSTLGDAGEILSDDQLTLSPASRSELLTIEASALIQLSELALAEDKLKQAEFALDNLDRNISSELARVAYVRGSIAILRGDPIGAEKSFKQTMALHLESQSETHPVVLRALHGLALALKNMGRLDDADQIFSNIVVATKKNMGAGHITVAETLGEWSRVSTDMGKHGIAIKNAKDALDIVFSTPEATLFQRGIANNAVGFTLLGNGQYTDAKEYFISGAAMLTEARGEYSSDLPPSLIALAEILISFNELASARQYIQRALEIIDKDASSTPDRAIKAYSNYARIEAMSGRCVSALEHVNTLLDLYEAYSLSAFKINGSTNDSKKDADRKFISESFDVLESCEFFDNMTSDDINLAFKALQIPQLKATSQAVVLSGLSSTVENTELKSLVEERDRLKLDWRQLELKLQQLLFTKNDDQYSKQLLTKLNEFDDKIQKIDAQLASSFPAFANLLNPVSIGLEEVQGSLKSSTAVLLQFTSEATTRLALVTKDSINIATTSLTNSQLVDAVESIRKSVGADFVTDEKLVLEFDRASAFFLYEKLFLPFKQQLDGEGVEHIVTIPDGAAQRIPFAMLLQSEHTEALSSARAYRRLDFLIKEYSLSVLPSVSSLQLLNTRDASQRPGNEKGSFIGFGDPHFEKIKRSDTRSASAYTEYISDRIDVNLLANSFDRIVETADELLMIQSLYESNSAQVYLGKDATEAKIKNTPLDEYSIIAFATHGVMADELSNVREPALIFTPPEIITDEDDGLLTASEVAQLNINADWVLLSACNTASPVAEQGADGLSGLTRSFFYAGAKSILVSHWAVESKSAQLITTGAISRYVAGEGLETKANSLRDSMLHLLDGEAGGRYIHPYYWAPFVHVGLD